MKRKGVATAVNPQKESRERYRDGLSLKRKGMGKPKHFATPDQFGDEYDRFGAFVATAGERDQRFSLSDGTKLPPAIGRVRSRMGDPRKTHEREVNDEILVITTPVENKMTGSESECPLSKVKSAVPRF